MYEKKLTIFPAFSTYSVTAVVNKFNVVPFFVGFRFFLMFGDYFETDNILATYRNSLLFVIISYRNVIFVKSAVTRAEFIFFTLGAVIMGSKS